MPLDKPSAGMALLMGMPEAKKEEASGMPSIPIPEGFMPPDDVTDGGSFEFTCRGYVKDGKLCIEEVNGVGTTAEEASEPESEKDAEDEMAEYTEKDELSQEEEGPDGQAEGMNFDDAIRKTRQRRM